jgi:hypothetical protein
MRSLALASLLLLGAALLPRPAAALALKPAIGLTFTDFTKDPQSGQAKGKTGWQLGGTVLLGEKLYFEGGAFYAQKSADITSTTPAGNVDLNAISGVRIPAMIGYHIVGDPSASLAVRAFGGAAMFIVTSVNATGLSKSDIESPTYGVFAGAGLDFMFLFLDVKYEWSLTDTSKISTVDVGNARSLYLNVGVRI